MGILDKKTRFIDLVVTQEGKRQIAAGKLRAEFASLTDANFFYEDNVASDASKRIYFEVMERPENSIVLEKDDSGQLVNLHMSPTGSIIGNQIFNKTQSSGSLMSPTPYSGSDFQIGMDSVIASSLNHFKKNYFLGTDDSDGDNDFKINVNEVEFTINNRQPFGGSPFKEVVNVNDAEPFFLDSKLAHLPNFQFLPPVDKDDSQIGDYQDIRSTKKETWADISKDISKTELSRIDRTSPLTKNILSNALKGWPFNSKRRRRTHQDEFKSIKLFRNGRLPNPPPPPKEMQVIRFTKTSSDNNLILQVYENSVGEASLTKLDVIDAGVFYDYDDQDGRYSKQVFYIGKVFYDSLKMPTFINIFTLIMD